MEKNAVYNSKKMLNWLNVNDGFKAFREGPKVDLRKDLRVSKRVNLIAQNSQGRIEKVVGREPNEFDDELEFSDEEEVDKEKVRDKV